MTAMDHVVLAVLSYVLTGAALIAYDLAQVPAQRRNGVMQRNLEVLVATWFMWPAAVAFEVINEHWKRQSTSSHWNFVVGVALLAATIFVWTHVTYLAVFWGTGIAWVGYTVTTIAMLLLCPLLVRVIMPMHRVAPAHG